LPGRAPCRSASGRTSLDVCPYVHAKQFRRQSRVHRIQCAPRSHLTRWNHQPSRHRQNRWSNRSDCERDTLKAATRNRERAKLVSRSFKGSAEYAWFPYSPWVSLLTLDARANGWGYTPCADGCGYRVRSGCVWIRKRPSFTGESQFGVCGHFGISRRAAFGKWHFADYRICRRTFVGVRF
jgi:hypothetical protein